MSTAQTLMKPGPQVPREEAERVVEQLREVTGPAEAHVRELTGLGAGLPLLPGDVVDRRVAVPALDIDEPYNLDDFHHYRLVHGLDDIGRR